MCSSRSHAVLTLDIAFNKSKDSEKYQPKLTIIDLAGSEKTNFEARSKGLLEGSNINKSLLALGNCINILSDKKKSSSFVPYRDSKLTRILKDSLGGNTKTVMIACVSQQMSSLEETINTLKYASKTFFIRKTLSKKIQGKAKNWNELQSLIDQLKQGVVC